MKTSVISWFNLGKIRKEPQIANINSIKSSNGIGKNVEKYGYSFANKLHKFGVLSLVFFITLNIGMFFKEYNSYWRARRVKY